MTDFQQKLLRLVSEYPGITDRHLTDIIFGKDKHQSQVNQEANLLCNRDLLERKRRPNGRIGNYIVPAPIGVTSRM